MAITPVGINESVFLDCAVQCPHYVSGRNVPKLREILEIGH